MPLFDSFVDSQHLRLDFISLKGYLVTLFLRGPEIRDGKSVLQVRAEVIHPAYWEGKVHAELKQKY